MPNVKSGDLAIITYSTVQENIGKIVEVLRPAYYGEEFMCNKGMRYVFKPSSSEYSWVIKGKDIKWKSNDGLNVSSHTERPMFDTCLKPIKPLDELEGEDEMLKIVKPKSKTKETL